MENITLSQALIMGSGLTGWAEEMTSDVRSLIIGILGIAGLIVALIIIVKNPTVGRTIIGVCVGAFIAGLPWIIPAVGDLLQGDLVGSGTGAPYALVEQETPNSTLES